jgi:hypothetical protein
MAARRVNSARSNCSCNLIAHAIGEPALKQLGVSRADEHRFQGRFAETRALHGGRLVECSDRD